MSGANTAFLDTNVLVYARDRNEPVKRLRAEALLTALFRAGQRLVSIQVLSEFFWAVTRKYDQVDWHRFGPVVVPLSAMENIETSGSHRPVAVWVLIYPDARPFNAAAGNHEGSRT